jgi:oligosaccharyltransferase complex subunit alpha (ribophorin I)
VKDSSPALKVLAVFTSLLEPFPAEIRQDENQLVKYSDNHYFFSPYRTENQRTAYTLASTSIESYTKRPPSSVRGSSVVFGPYKDIAPFEVSPMIIHSVNNKPFAKFSSMLKEVEVSHWGMISVEEVYELQHAGAKLKGGFSRFDYQSKRFGETPSFRSIKAVLPSEANNIYYRDQIGNISTSDLAVRSDGIEMEIQTRFPIFGGWQTQFYIGYSVPTETALSTDLESNRYKLKVDFFSVFQDVWVEDLEIKVILPEGCTGIDVNVPYAVEQSWTTR